MPTPFRSFVRDLFSFILGVAIAFALVWFFSISVISRDYHVLTRLFANIGFDHLSTLWQAQWGLATNVGFLLMGVMLLAFFVARLGVRDYKEGLNGRITFVAVVGVFVIYGFAFWAGKLGQNINLLHTQVPSFGMVDPIFGKDPGFYIATLPWLRFECSIALAAILWFAVIGIVFAITDGAEEVENRIVAMVVITILALFLLHGWYLAKIYPYSQMTSGGTVVGVGATDFVIRIPQARLFSWLIPSLGIGLFVGAIWSAWSKKTRYISLSATVLVLALVVGWVRPILYQTFTVERQGQEFAYETERLGRNFLSYNMEASRQAYELDGANLVERTGSAEVLPRGRKTYEAVAADPAFREVRAWDTATALSWVNVRQEFATVYGIPSMEPSRFPRSDGGLFPVMIGCREAFPDQLDRQNQNWQTRHLIYTHGYGCVILGADASTGVGAEDPSAIVGQIPMTYSLPAGVIIPRITQPEIYFGVSPDTEKFVVVGTEIREFDQNGASSVYTGTGGIEIGTGAARRRLAWYLEGGFRGYFATLNRLQNIPPTARVLFVRDIRARVKMLAPFLRVSEFPYTIFRDDGTLATAVDVFVATTEYPYSERFGNANYMRHAGVAVMDNYNGPLQLYLVQDKPDPLTEAWRERFPKLFMSRDEVPADVARQLRYPDEMALWRLAGYGEYHVTDEWVFFQGSGIYKVPQERFGLQTKDELAKLVDGNPYYQVVQLAGSNRPTYQSLVSMSPLSKPEVLAAYVAFSSEWGEFGLMRVVLSPGSLSDDRKSPLWFEGRVDGEFQAYLGGLLTGGSLIRGATFVISVKDNYLYLEPLFTPGDKYPIFNTWFLADPSATVCGSTLLTALQRLYGMSPHTTTDCAIKDESAGNSNGGLIPQLQATEIVSGTLPRGDYGNDPGAILGHVVELLQAAESEPNLATKQQLYDEAALYAAYLEQLLLAD